MPDCLFCNIVARESPAKIVHEDAETLAFEDIRPQAPNQLLVIPVSAIAASSMLSSSTMSALAEIASPGTRQIRRQVHRAVGGSIPRTVA